MSHPLVDELRIALHGPTWQDLVGAFLARLVIGFAYGVGFALAWRLCT